MEEETDKEIIITYETLFELLRMEKLREELQKLDPSFYQDVVDYLQKKIQILEKQEHKSDLFAVEERLKTEKQHRNIKKILKELYERREKKIINMALDASRTFSTIIDTSALLAQEKQFFDHAVNLLNKFRKSLLWNILEAQPPVMEEKQAEEKGIEMRKEPEEPQLDEKQAETSQPETKQIRFTSPVPKFLGLNLEQYGPFEKEDTSNLPNKIADLLIRKERAEEMR